MKRLLMVLVLTMVAFGVTCQTVYYKSQATLQWDAVTQDAGGQPLLPTDVVDYEVYIYDYTVGVADPQNVGLLTIVTTTSLTEALIVFPYRTTWAAGVRTKLTDAGANVSYSALAWSYVVADADAVLGPFVYSPQGGPRKPAGLQDKGM